MILDTSMNWLLTKFTIFRVQSSVKSIGKCQKNPYIIKPKPFLFKTLLWSHFWIQLNKLHTKTFGIVYILFVYLLIMFIWAVFIILYLYKQFLRLGQNRPLSYPLQTKTFGIVHMLNGYYVGMSDFYLYMISDDFSSKPRISLKYSHLSKALGNVKKIPI
jgi:hypothetical protein